MPQRVLSVGQCDPDDADIAGLLADHFDVVVGRVMFPDEALAALSRIAYDLVLVNRLIYVGRAPGIELIRRMQADAGLKAIPVMMVSNFAKAQAEAVAAGARPGFGKDQLGDGETIEKLGKVLRGKA